MPEEVTSTDSLIAVRTFHVVTGQLVIRLRLDTSPNVKARDYPAGF